MNAYVSRNEIKTVELVLYGAFILGVKMKYICTDKPQYRMCEFGDSTYELNVLIAAFKTGIEQHKGEW